MFSLVETYEGKNNFLSATLDMLSLLNLGTGEQAEKIVKMRKRRKVGKEEIMYRREKMSLHKCR